MGQLTDMWNSQMDANGGADRWAQVPVAPTSRARIAVVQSRLMDELQSALQEELDLGGDASTLVVIVRDWLAENTDREVLIADINGGGVWGKSAESVAACLLDRGWTRGPEAVQS